MAGPLLCPAADFRTRLAGSKYKSLGIFGATKDGAGMGRSRSNVVQLSWEHGYFTRRSIDRDNGRVGGQWERNGEDAAARQRRTNSLTAKRIRVGLL